MHIQLICFTDSKICVQMCKGFWQFYHKTIVGTHSQTGTLNRKTSLFIYLLISKTHQGYNTNVQKPCIVVN